MRTPIQSVIILSFTLLSVFGYGQSGQSGKVNEITIKYSGFLEPETITIRFDGDYDIVEVLKQGKAVPKDSLYRYEPLLYDYLQYRELKGIMPRVSRLKRELRRGRHVDSLRIREAIRLQRDLDSLRYSLAVPLDSMRVQLRENVRIKRTLDSLRVRIRRHPELRIRRAIDREMERTKNELEDVRIQLREEIREQAREIREKHKEKMEGFIKALKDEGLIKEGDEVNIRNEHGSCTINGRKLTPEENALVKKLWNKYLDSAFEKTSATIHI